MVQIKAGRHRRLLQAAHTLMGKSKASTDKVLGESQSFVRAQARIPLRPAARTSDLVEKLRLPANMPTQPGFQALPGEITCTPSLLLLVIISIFRDRDDKQFDNGLGRYSTPLGGFNGLGGSAKIRMGV